MNPIYLPLFLFWTGDLNRLCKNMGSCLTEFFPEIKPPRKNRQGVSSPQRNNSGRSLTSGPSSETLPSMTVKQNFKPENKISDGNGIETPEKSVKPTGINTLSPVKKLHYEVSKKKSGQYWSTLVFYLLLTGVGLGVGLYFFYKYKRFGSR